MLSSKDIFGVSKIADTQLTPLLLAPPPITSMNTKSESAPQQQLQQPVDAVATSDDKKLETLEEMFERLCREEAEAQAAGVLSDEEQEEDKEDDEGDGGSGEDDYDDGSVPLEACQDDEDEFNDPVELVEIFEHPEDSEVDSDSQHKQEEHERNYQQGNGSSCPLSSASAIVDDIPS